MSAIQDYYQTLGLTHRASDEEIKKAFKKLAIKYHPDKTDDEQHHALFIKINEAYETLKGPETRRAYDQTKGYNSNYPTASTSTSYTPFSTHTSTSSTYTYTNGNSYRDSYFGVYQLYYRNPFSNIFNRTRQEKSPEKDKQPFENRYKSDLDEFNERLRTHKDNYQAYTNSRNSPKKEHHEDDTPKREEKTYAARKQEEMRRQWDSPFRQYDPDRLDEAFKRNNDSELDHQTTPTSKGRNSSDPIVVEEEPAESEEEFVTVVEDLADDPQVNTTPFFQARAATLSPEKLSPHIKTNARTSYMRNEPPSSKRQKKSDGFQFDDLKSTLSKNIDEVDLREILESLPELKRQRSSSEQKNTVGSKRPKYEFTDGTSKADTLHIPINKKSYSSFLAAGPEEGLSQKPLTMLDLHASNKIYEFESPVPPNIAVGPQMKDSQWQAYVSAIQSYEHQFLEYKQNIIQYQFERSKKDAQHYDIINSQPESFEVYQNCLNQDVDVLQKYVELLRIYTATMELYKQNCKWMQLRTQKETL